MALVVRQHRMEIKWNGFSLGCVVIIAGASTPPPFADSPRTPFIRSQLSVLVRLSHPLDKLFKISIDIVLR